MLIVLCVLGAVVTYAALAGMTSITVKTCSTAVKRDAAAILLLNPKA
jgi:hypothetical protein